MFLTVSLIKYGSCPPLLSPADRDAYQSACTAKQLSVGITHKCAFGVEFLLTSLSEAGASVESKYLSK